MSTYILIHGAWHGAWCWYKLLPLLRRAGHEVVAPDLPGLGIDTTPIANISLASWTEHICKIVDAQPDPVVLVGHSRGGLILSGVAEQRPKKVARLVYVTALLLRNGEVGGQLLAEDGTSLVIPHRVVASDGQSSMIRAEVVREAFYGESPEEDVALAKLLLRPEPASPAATAMNVTNANFGSVPRVYIECLRDRAIPLSLQKRMYASLPCERVMSIDTDHSPFFSGPQILADCLRSVAPES